MSASVGGAATLLDPDTQGRTLISYSSVVQSDGVKLLWVVLRSRREERRAESVCSALCAERGPKIPNVWLPCVTTVMPYH